MSETIQKEKEPEIITDLDELQQQARQNTKELNLLRRKVDTEQNEDIKQELNKEIFRRRSRSGALIRRRNSLVQKEQEKQREVEENLKRELAERFQFPALEQKKKELLGQLESLANDADRAQAIARGETRRSEAVLLAALARWSRIAFEALRKSPSLRVDENRPEPDEE